MLAFFRDRQVHGGSSVEQQPGADSVMASVSASLGYGSGGARGGASLGHAVSGGAAHGDADAGGAQPYGVLPVLGLAVLAAPLCYLFEHPAAVHRLFRSMYCRYWCKLYSLSPVSGHSPALPGLVKTYEQLLQVCAAGIPMLGMLSLVELMHR